MYIVYYIPDADDVQASLLVPAWPFLLLFLTEKLKETFFK
jgi:hypothetical protein